MLETAAIGATPKGGIRRLTLTDLDRQVRDWFRAACEAAGCTVTVDEMGNMFARRPGRDNARPAVSIGSHLDTQPTGGKFDGVLGVLAGLEVLRTLNDLEIETDAPIEVVNWTNEEGARFAPAMLASGVFAGVYSRDWADSRQDREGKRFGAELERIGYRGPERCGARVFAAHFELHIEQGPILEAEEKAIGIVTGVQAIRWFEVEVTGSESHAGSTPMHLRHDAMLAAARMIDAVNGIAVRHQGVGTVGLVECRPGSPNVIPGSAFFTIDLRHPSDAAVEAMEQEARASVTAIAEAGAVEAPDPRWS
ncbi:MAG: M20 family metallo-hydrolase [Solirubrobacteraceae bacterium]